jgi:Cupin domain
MAVVRNDAAPEVPWRPGYRSFVLAGKEQGLSCSSSLGVLEPGAGAPLHVHRDADEIFIVMAGRLELRLGDERQVVGEGIPSPSPLVRRTRSPRSGRSACASSPSCRAAARSPAPRPISKARRRWARTGNNRAATSPKRENFPRDLPDG